MYTVPATLKIFAVGAVSASIAYIHFLLFHASDFKMALHNASFLLVSAAIYVMVVGFFCTHYLRLKKYLTLVVWLIFNLALAVNFVLYFFDKWPPLAVQYSQSSSLLIYTSLLLFSKDNFPNWSRIFAVSALVILIPCLIFYFSETWLLYEVSIYALSLTPIIHAFVFLKQERPVENDLIDR